MNRLDPIFAALCVMVFGAACARPGGAPPPQPRGDRPANAADSSAAADTDPEDPPEARRPSEPFTDPRFAMQIGLMPHASMGVEALRQRFPEYDGRGVVIGILDTGVDLGLPGFQLTSTGEPKVLDARDFSGEGFLPLTLVEPAAGSVTFGGHTLRGFASVAGQSSGPYYAGVFREIPIDVDADGNKKDTDEFLVIVARTSSGWAVFADADGDGTLLDEAPVHDYLVAGEYFSFSHRNDNRTGGDLSIAANFTEEAGRPVLNLFFDNAAHGSHVGGISGGHNMFGVEGFNGVAPGAQFLALKIANATRGGITTTGSILRAMNYAAEFAQQRSLPLVLNLSFGVGNDVEGHAAIDSMVGEFVLKHPDVLYVISAGNDGPGVSTLGFPGSAPYALTVCALFPGAFTGSRPPGFAVDADEIAAFSSRGGELAKPDICAPGLAFSNVPPWNLGNEVSGGTSMAAPQIAGLAAVLQSAMTQNGNPARAMDIKMAIMSSARPARSGTVVDMGAGTPRVERALEWLQAGHQAGLYEIVAEPDGGNTSVRDAAYRRNGFASEADTTQRFTIRSVAGQPAANFVLRSDAPWLRAPPTMELRGEPAAVEVRYQASRLRTPGMYVGSVWATPASDTLAGAAFRLTSTIIVPQSVDQPFTEGRDLGPGRLRRYFFDVPADAGGFSVEMELRYATQRGTVYLFEPTGQPFRGGSSADAGGGEESTATIEVRGEDLVPGVWEVVVVAPSASALSYELRAAVPRYIVETVASGPTAVIKMRNDPPTFVQEASVFQRVGEFSVFEDSVQIQGRLIGAASARNVEGAGDTPVRIPLVIPSWAGELEVEVSLPAGLWSQYTDFGVTVFDSTGAKQGEGPLSYQTGRLHMDLLRVHRGATLELELFPAFAHMDPPAGWSAEIRIGYIARNAVDLKPLNVDTTQAFAPGPGETVAVQFQPVAADALVLPPGFDRLFEIKARPAGGASSGRRRMLVP